MATLRQMMHAMAEKRGEPRPQPPRQGKRLGRPPKAETEKLGEAKFSRFTLEQEAAIELHRQEMERRLLRKVDTSEALREMVEIARAAKGARGAKVAKPA